VKLLLEEVRSELDPGRAREIRPPDPLGDAVYRGPAAAASTNLVRGCYLSIGTKRPIQYTSPVDPAPTSSSLPVQAPSPSVLRLIKFVSRPLSGKART